MSSDELKRLTVARGQAKGAMTRLYRFSVDPDARQATRSEIVVKRDRLQKTFTDYCDYNVEISILDPSNSEDFGDMEEKYYKTLAFFEEALSVKIDTREEAEVACKLPPINLNKFSGEVSDYVDFMSLFKSVVDSNQSLSSCTKFYHLKSLLLGEPAHLIQHLQLSAENYITALQLLDERYNNKSRLVNLHINALLDLKQITKTNAAALRDLVSKTRQHVGALKNLEIPAQHWDAILIAILQRKIDQYSLRCYHLELKDNSVQSLDVFLNFLDQRASALESVADNSPVQAGHQPNNRRASLVTTDKRSPDKPVLCNFCKSKYHRLHQCEKFKLAAVLERITHVNNHNLCELCLNKHSNKCRLLLKCSICKQKHNSLLHQDKASETAALLPKVSSLSTSRFDNVLLPTIKVCLYDKHGRMIHVRALCDSGSQISFILSALAARLDCKLYNEPTSLVGVCDSANTVGYKTDVDIYSTTSDIHTKVTCCVTDSITCDLPQFQINRNNLKIPSHILLADPEFDECQPISMLLGCDIFFKILGRDQIPISPPGLYLHDTSYGYIIAGRMPHTGTKRQSDSGNFCGHVSAHPSELIDDNASVNDLEAIMKKFWSCDSVPETYREATTEHQLAEDIFSSTVVLKHNRFQVDLPLKQTFDDLNMGHSLSRALKRFLNLEKRFEKDPVLFQTYKDFIAEYLALGHAQYVDISKYDLEGGKAYFLPHHPVFNENSKTTRVRVVFDGSMKSDLNFSLNDILLNGPVVQNDLFSIMILFRLHKYILIADIQKLFRQTKLNPDHCALQNILWRDTPTEGIKCIQLQTITYGLKSSTFLSTRCLLELAHRFKNEYPLAAEVLIRNTYVDDVNTGSNDLTQLIETKRQLTDLLKLGGFELHKWCANNKKILADVPTQLQNVSDVDFCHDDAAIKTLGITYKIKTDTLHISCPRELPCEVDRYTKRQVLSLIGRFFDVLGLAGPIVVAAKLIMQKTWQLKISWDSYIPDDLASEFSHFLQSLNTMQAISVNRNINTQNIELAELVGYADASAKSFGCCIYFRTIDKEGKVEVTLLCSKSRVNPIKPLSIPRLELNAALLLATLMRKVYDQVSGLGLNIQFYLHSDSQVVLAWLRTEPAGLSVYVANRVKQVNVLTNGAAWSYVNTADNPADCLSKGVEPHMLKDVQLWWNGPQNLRDPSHRYHNEFQLPSELPETKVCNTATVSNQKFDLLSKFSSIHKLKRIVALIYRFYNNCKTQTVARKFTKISCKELDSALKVIIRVTQREHYIHETEALLHNKPIKSNLKRLNPFIDAKGVMRVGGRLQQANLPYYQRHPIILPKKSNITKLIISDEHIMSLHANAKIIIGNLSQRYYLADCKRVIKNIVHRCITCFKLKAKASQQLMGSLPADRVTPHRVFGKVGVDFGGPFLIKMHRVRKPIIYKAYIALFVCFTTKAIHIELVSNLTTECFLECLKRFIARRNKPSVIYCDNASTFKGAQNQLHQLYLLQNSRDHQDVVSNFATERGIEFSFIPSYSPVFGGLWEAGIKGAKYHLKRVVGQQVLTYEELNSVVIQVEGVLNSRPLLPLQGIDSDDMSYLTPGHFLTGASLSTYPEPDVTEIPINRLSFWKQCTRIVQCFWKEWQKQYLTQLQSRPKWHKTEPNISKGTLVLLREINAPPLTWKTARVIETFPGTDGKVRALSVKTSKGTIIRTSVTKVCVLPIHDDDTHNLLSSQVACLSVHGSHGSQ